MNHQVDIVNRNYLAPGLDLGDCHARPDSAAVDPDRQKPDAAFYRTSAVPSDGKPHWIDQLVPVEFKAWKSGDNLQDPYTDKPDVPGGVAVTQTVLRKKNFGQIISYAEMVFLDRLWPDFTREDLWEAIRIFHSRDRRYGGAVDAPKA